MVHQIQCDSLIAVTSYHVQSFEPALPNHNTQSRTFPTRDNANGCHQRSARNRPAYFTIFHISATTPHLFNGLLYNLGKLVPEMYKKLSYRRGTARWVVSVKILPIATQQCRNYLYGKSWTNRNYEVGGLVGQCVINMCTQPWLDRVASIVL